MGLLGENGIEFVPYDTKLRFLAILDNFAEFIVFSPLPQWFGGFDFGSILCLGQDNSLLAAITFVAFFFRPPSSLISELDNFIMILANK